MENSQTQSEQSSQTSVNNITVQQVEKIVPKARFIGNDTGCEILIISDLKNEVDEYGLTLQPGEKIDLINYYEPKQINRSRGLDNFLSQGKVKKLNSLDDMVKPKEKSFSEQSAKGSTFEAKANFADDNLYIIEEKDRRIEEKQKNSILSRKTTVPKEKLL